MNDGHAEEIDRPDPEDDPFACTICGQPLGTVKRVEGEEHCDGCIHEYVGEHGVTGGVNR